MSLLLAMHGWDPAQWTQRISARAPSRKMQIAPGGIDDPNAVRYALAWAPPTGLLATLPNLQVIFSLGAGVDHLLDDPDLPDVPIVRIVDDSLTRLMSEWVLLQVLMHHRRQLLYLDQQRRGDWRPRGSVAADKVRVGVMGLGELGRDASDMLRHVGYQVAGWSRTPKSLAGVTCYHGRDGLQRFLARTDILVALLPLTEETTGILNRDLFERLARDGAIKRPILINAGRGKSHIEDDILRALDDGILGGASLDVFEEEPLSADSPLWIHPKVVVTPHVAAESDPEYLVDYIFDQIERFEAGGKLKNVVDRQRGY